MSKILQERGSSGFGLSIGTDLALETLFEPTGQVIDPERKVPPKANLNNYDIVVVNIETLLRNMISSINTEAVMRVKFEDWLDTLIDEIYLMKKFFNERGLYVEFYMCTYEYYYKKYFNTMRSASTQKQLTEEKIHKYCTGRIMGRLRDINIRIFKQLVNYDPTYRVLMFTHVPADLLSYTNFRSLELLESNTGVIKTRKDFNSKYLPVPREDMSFLPFNESLLVTFGDKVMFKPKPVKERLEVYNKLRAARVNPLTSGIRSQA